MKSVIINEKDNIGVCLDGNDSIPAGHKYALCGIQKGECVIKYGEIIGRATQDIKAGEWTTLYCPINYYDLTNMTRSYIFRLPACADYDDFTVFIDNIRFVNEIPA